MKTKKENEQVDTSTPEETEDLIATADPELLINRSFCSEWKAHNGSAQELERYIKKEILETKEKGYAVLSTILALEYSVDLLVKTRALMLLKSDPDLASEIYEVKLKLIPKEFRTRELPIHDYNGCLLPEKDKRGKQVRGKVISVKISHSSDRDISLKGSVDEAAKIIEQKYGGRAFIKAQENAKRVYKSRNLASPYYCAEIGDEPVTFNLDEATSVLQRYGYGIAKTPLGRTLPWFVQEHIS